MNAANKNEVLIERWITDSAGRPAIVLGFAEDNASVILGNEAGDTTSFIPLEIMLADENDLEASGAIARRDRITCPDCECFIFEDRYDRHLSEFEEEDFGDEEDADIEELLPIWLLPAEVA